MSIATRIQAMEEHISNAYDSLNKLGVTANNKNIENIAGLIDEIYNNSPKTDYASGTDLAIEDTRIGKIDFKDTDNIEKIGLGATNQLITTGKNLLDESKLRQGAFNYTSHTARLFIDGNYYLSAGTYTFVTNLDLTRFRYGVDVASSQFPLSSSQSIDVYDSGWVSNSTQHTFTLTQSGYLGLGISKSNGTDTLTPSDVANYWFMIYSGNYDSSISYEKYTGGTASPNPSYPQDVNVVAGSIGIKTSNKNLIENETFVQGTFNGNSSNRISCRNIKLKANTTYTFSSNLNYSTYNAAIVTSTNQFPIQISETPKYDSGWKTATFSFTTGNDDVYANIAVKKVGELAITPSDVAGYHFQIEKGTTATSYVKHYEQEYELNLRKNLFNKDDAQIIHAWFLKTSTAISVNSGNDTIVYIPCQPNTTYTASKIQEPNQNKNTLVLGTTTTQPTNNTPLNVKEGQQGGTITEVTITTGPNDYYLCAFCYSKNNANTYNETEMLASLQIEEGSQATSYVSYFPPIELCQIGQYQDYIYKNNGNWFIHKEIGKVIWNGTENWTVNPGISTTYVIARPSDLAYGNNNVFYNYFSTVADLSVATEGARIGSSINLKNPNTADLASFKSWLSTHNTTMYYQSSTPAETQITDENLISQLNAWYNVQSMDDITYITVDGNLPMQLKLRALKK